MKYNKEQLINRNTKLTRSDFVFFWGHQNRQEGQGKACLSQWYLCPFIVDDVYYNCAEQYMMAEKARIFGDNEMRNQILSTYSQMEMKKLGRKVQGYDDEVWRAKRAEVVQKGNIAKFSQNAELEKFLIGTGSKILVEASPKDNIWGIGLEESSPDATEPHKWLGENLLGFTLMEVRDLLLETQSK